MLVTEMYTLYYLRDFAVVLVSNPEYLGLALILQENLLNRWERFQILWIFRVFPHLVIENAGFVVDCPDYLRIFACKSRENMDFRLGNHRNVVQ